MSAPVDLSKVKWLALCDQASVAALLRPLCPAADGLAIVAGRLTTIKPLPFVPCDEALLTSFRWDCTAFSLAQPITRRILAPGLQAKAQLVRLLLSPPDPLGGAEALAVPAEPENEPHVHAWLRRPDCGVG